MKKKNQNNAIYEALIEFTMKKHGVDRMMARSVLNARKHNLPKYVINKDNQSSISK